MKFFKKLFNIHQHEYDYTKPVLVDRGLYQIDKLYKCKYCGLCDIVTTPTERGLELDRKIEALRQRGF